MALITALGLFAVGVLTATFSRLLAEDIADWSQWLIRRLTKTAVSWLPEKRDRYSEEWESDLNDRPGRITKLQSASGFLIAAFKINLTDERNQQIERWLHRIRQIDQCYARVAAAANVLQSGELYDLDQIRFDMESLQLHLKETDRHQRELESEVLSLPNPVQFAAMKKVFARRIRRIDENFDEIIRKAEKAAQGRRTDCGELAYAEENSRDLSPGRAAGQPTEIQLK
jgi:hypothetical protein